MGMESELGKKFAMMGTQFNLMVVILFAEILI